MRGGAGGPPSFDKSNRWRTPARTRTRENPLVLLKSTPLSPSSSDANSNCSSPLETWENITVKQCQDGSTKAEFEPE